MTFLAQVILGTLICNPSAAPPFPAGTCLLSLIEPLQEGNWLTFFSENHVIVSGNYPTGTRTLSIGPTEEKIYLLQFYNGDQIKAEWIAAPLPCTQPITTNSEITIQPVGEPIILRALKTPLRLIKKLRKRK